METELKNARAEVRRLKQEKESYEQDYHDLTKTKDETHVELKDMRGQLRDFKYRETRCEHHQSTLSLLFFFSDEKPGIANECPFATMLSSQLPAHLLAVQF